MSASQTLQNAIVKSVQSGDSIIIRSQPKGGPPPEKQINLAYLIAPKISRKLPDGSHTADEPFAWESREFLRKKLVGKVIQFRVEYKVPFGNNQRECATIFLGTENINETLVNEGLVEVVKRAQNKDNPDVVRLIELEEAVKSSGSKGKWAGNAIKRTILQEFENSQSFVGKTLDGIVEHVRDGSTMKIGLVLPSNDQSSLMYQMAMVVLSGVRCPQTNEPFGEEARFFTESRLLQRDVQVHVEQINPGGSTIVATVAFMDRDIAEYLLREGYAKCIDRTLGMTKDPKKLRSLESEAKSRKIRIWKDFKETVRSSSSMNFEAKVLEISSPDSLVIQHNESKEIKKIFLASIRAPRLVNDDGQTVLASSGGTDTKKQFRPLYDIPFMFEAREFLRKKLIGKAVKVRVDYVQPKNENFPEKTCCTVLTSDGQNIAEQLVMNGLVTVVKYRQDDDQRASDYDSYLAAEQKAQKNNKGLHSNKPEAGMIRIADLSMDLSKAKSMAPFLTRSTGIRRDAVIEYVFPSSTKLKVYIPKESCLVNLVLSGVNTPRPNDPMLADAVQHVRLRVLQRDVQVEIETVDKIGNYIGSVYYEKNNNLALDLVRNGLLSVREYNKNMELNNAEKEAKTARRGIWKDYKEEVAVENVEEVDLDGDNETAPVVDDIAQRKRVIITNLAKDFTSFHAQQVKDGQEIEAMLQRLRQEATANPPIAGSYRPKKGDLVMAKFSEDGLWYRARVEKTVNSNESQVIYIDYGNRETLDNKNIASLPLGNFASIPAAAKEYAFAFVFPDTDEEFLEEVRAVFMDITANKVLLLKTEYKDVGNGLEAATLLDETSKKDIVLQMVKDGWLFVDTKTRRDRRLLKKINEYKEAQEYAKKNGLNLWQYGDVTPDDAKEFGYPSH
uniref:Staphylococcal nuclease domain-containing protein 1 n=1 Tax=Dermatophagoides pteronyssinus TaxID=6956 RepID=A0A6P6Y182_DERPT|nr:staphylococcal nuclease domain-containing protein 1-like [Dermatophagoides pteronyssinus]